MSVRRRAIGALVATLALLGGLVAVAPAASAATDTTVMVMRGDVGDYIAGPTDYLYTPADTDFTTQGIENQAYFSAIQPGYTHWWYLDLRAPVGEVLTAGTTYTGAERAAFASAGHPGLDVSGDGRGCNTVSGSFTVLEIARDPATDLVTRFAASFEQHCEGGTAAARGSLYFHSTLPYAVNAALTLTGPTFTPPGEPVHLQGTLSDGTAPVAGATVSVSRTDATGTTALPDVTTGGDGTYVVDDTMPATSAVYTATFAGDANVQALGATWAVKAQAYPSALPLVAPSTVKRGTAYTVTGTLTSHGVVIPGALVTVKRVDLAGTRTSSARTSAVGVVSLRDVPAVGGPVTWTLSWAGDVTHAAVTAARAVTIARAATALTVKVSGSVFNYGVKAIVTVHLGTTYNHRDVYIYGRPLGAPAAAAPGRLIAHVRVNSAGNAVVSYLMRSRTTFTARFLGDYRYAAAARATSPYVRARVSLVLGGWSSRSGSTYIYRGTDPAQLITVSPNRAGQCFYAQVQAFQGGRWVTVAAANCFGLDGASHGYAILRSNRARGVLIRIRAYVGNDSVTQTLGGTSPWVYLTFA
jgi:hypothetical protein